uniref:Uncharacterized protein n=1 Tax=Knipowitschia caucasica TaxID=637954 RepID=A0AAV2JMJ0_KNICA
MDELQLMVRSLPQPPGSRDALTRLRTSRPELDLHLCKQTMVRVVWMCVIALGLDVVAGSRDCPDVVVESCQCDVERSKELSRQPPQRVKVVCAEAELMDTLHPSFLPNRTVLL